MAAEIQLNLLLRFDREDSYYKILKLVLFFLWCTFGYVQNENHISLLIEQNKMLMEMMCELTSELRYTNEEVKKLKVEISTLNKVINHKAKSVKKKETKEDFLKKFRANQLLKN